MLFSSAKKINNVLETDHYPSYLVTDLYERFMNQLQTDSILDFT